MLRPLVRLQFSSPRSPHGIDAARETVMASIIAGCPHCGGEKLGFTSVGEYQIATPEHSTRFETFFRCNNCQRGLIVNYLQRGANQYLSPAACPADPAQFGFFPVVMYPSKEPAKVPGHTPEPLGRYFQQAFDGCQRGDNDASGAMSRKVIDVSTKMLLGEEFKKYGNIRDRIDALATKGALTSDLKNWAHEIRLGGNEAAHDEEPYSKEEAEELLDFAELYLTYVYTLPGRLKERRERAAAEKAAKESN